MASRASRKSQRAASLEDCVRGPCKPSCWWVCSVWSRINGPSTAATKIHPHPARQRSTTVGWHSWAIEIQNSISTLLWPLARRGRLRGSSFKRSAAAPVVVRIPSGSEPAASSPGTNPKQNHARMAATALFQPCSTRCCVCISDLYLVLRKHRISHRHAVRLATFRVPNASDIKLKPSPFPPHHCHLSKHAIDHLLPPWRVDKWLHRICTAVVRPIMPTCIQ